MNYSEFHAVVREIAKGRYFTTGVEANEQAARWGARLTLRFKAYIEGEGWVEGSTCESVLEEIATPTRTVDTIDPLPAPLPPEVSPSPTLPDDDAGETSFILGGAS